VTDTSLIVWKHVLHRGATATRAEARAIEQRVQDAPLDLVARVEALACTKGDVRAGHLLWLINSAPWLPLEEFWMCRQDNPGYETAKQAWLATVTERPEDVSVAANAPWCLMASEPTLAEEILDRQPRAVPSLAWMQALEGFYATRIGYLLVNADEAELSQVAARARSNLAALFAATPTDRERYALLWPLRRYAAMAHDPIASALYMAAAKESDRGAHEHVVRTIRGLVAAAQGDLPGAEKWLLGSANVVDGDTAPAVSLAEEILRRGNRETVRRYIEACEAVVGSRCTPLTKLRARLEGGE
jgi:hypothetical protein